MHLLFAALFFPALVMVAYTMGYRKILSQIEWNDTARRPSSVPGYYGAYVALWAAGPWLLMYVLWSGISDQIILRQVLSDLSPAQLETIAEGFDFFPEKVKARAEGQQTALPQGSAYYTVVESAAEYYRTYEKKSYLLFWLASALLVMISLWESLQNVTPEFRARRAVDRYARALLFVSASVSVLVTAAIIGSVLFEALQFFETEPVFDFLFGLQWSPQTAIRADQAGGSGAFGAVPLFLGTLMITGIAMLVAVPVGLFAAIYMAEYAHKTTRAVAKPLLEILAGIPTVVYGYFAIVTLAPWLRELGALAGLTVSSESVLGAGLVMGIMIIPFISSLSDDIITAVPRSLREASMGLGATRSETIRKVVLPSALPGIMGAGLLAVSRAIGETMIVVMAAGLAANITFNPLDSVTTVTAQIVSLLTGDQEFDSAKTLSAFALGLALFVVTLCLNVIALIVVKKYREQYE